VRAAHQQQVDGSLATRKRRHVTLIQSACGQQPRRRSFAFANRVRRGAAQASQSDGLRAGALLDARAARCLTRLQHELQRSREGESTADPIVAAADHDDNRTIRAENGMGWKARN
jgi:hypothetical protein